MISTIHDYTRRIDRVVDYLRDNLNQSHKLEDLARIACLSEFHFHRIFKAATGETVNEFTNRLRLEKAARLLTKSCLNLTEIALECGFSSSATFSRSFRNVFETTPSDYRRTQKLKNSKICKDLFEKNEYILPMSDDEKRVAFPVRIVDIPAREVAYIRVANAFESERVIGAFARIIDWAKSADVFDHGTLFGMSIDDPAVTPKKLYRYEVCFAPGVPFECPDDISRTAMPTRKYAVTRAKGDIKMIATATDYLAHRWIAGSGFERDHAPGLEIFNDKSKATDWSSFDLELAVPVRNAELR